MSNEELVKLIQEGHKEYIPQLWKQIEAFISLQAYKRLNALPEHYWCLRDDMVNQSYFYFLRAIDGYKDNKAGSFLTYLTYHLKNGFKEVIYGGRTERAMREPLNEAMSLDKPLGEEQDFTLASTLIDEQSEAYYRHIDDVDFWEDVNSVLRQGIERIEGRPGEVLQVMLDNDVDLAGASKIMDYPVTRQQYHNCYRIGTYRLRRFMTDYIHKRENRNSCIEDYIGYSYGAARFMRTGTSAVEYAVMKKVDRDLKYADMLHCIKV